MKAIKIGDRSGRLTATSIRADGRIECRCECDRSIVISHSDFVSRRKRSCGCRYRRIKLGQTYGRLTVTSEPKYGEVAVICSCGNEKGALVANLKAGLTRSCGCLRSPKDRVHDLREFWNDRKIGEYQSPLTGSLCPEWSDFDAFARAVGKLGWRVGKVIEAINFGQQIGPNNVRIL